MRGPVNNKEASTKKGGGYIDVPPPLSNDHQSRGPTRGRTKNTVQPGVGR